MKTNKLFTILGLTVATSLVLAACAAPAPTPTPEPTQPPPTATPTQAPERQAQPTEAPPTPEPRAGVHVLILPLLMSGSAPTPTPEPRTGGWLDTITMLKISTDAVLTQLQAEEIDIYASTLGRAEQFKAAQDAGLAYTQNFGDADELTFNPYGGGDNGALFDQSTGKLNPFAIPAIREAMNMLVDRDYIVQEIYGGLASPKFFPITSAFPDYARLADVARELEAKYAYNEAKAEEIITAEMEKLGATKVDGKWTYKGEPVTLIFIIRNDGDGTRKLIGDYVSAQLEKIGFTVDRQYKTSSEATPIWMRGNPADGLWHLYTGGWVTKIVERDQGGNFLFYYTKDRRPVPLWQAYKPTEEFYELAQALSNNNFKTLEERRELFAKALRLAMEDSVRVWLVDQKAFSPYRPNVSVTGDLAGGVQGSQLQAFTLRFADKVGGDLKYAMSDLLVDPWNPVAGSNWVFDTAPKRFINDYGVIADPFTGLVWPQRIESASVEVKEGLPVGKTLDWVDFKFVPEIKVPADAFIDWDAEKQVFITVGEKFPDGLTANRKSTVTYPKDFFQKTKWHDGSNFSAADFMMRWIMTFDRAKEASKIYDKSAARPPKSFKGFRIVSTDPFVVEYYSDAFALDAELNVFDHWPEYTYGNGAWHMIAIGNLAEENGELAYSADKASAKKIEWMSYIGGPSLEILKKYLDQAANEKYIPYAPTLSNYITPEEAAARYENLANWYAKQGHFWIGTGPYYLDKVFSVEKTLTLKRNPDFQDPADKWARFAEPKIAEAEVDGEGRVTIGKEASFDVIVTFKGQPYPAAEIQEVKYLLFDANNALAASGNAEATGDGQYTVKLDADVTSKLAEGSNKLEVVVISKLVSIPTFASFQFVTVK